MIHEGQEQGAEENDGRNSHFDTPFGLKLWGTGYLDTMKVTRMGRDVKVQNSERRLRKNLG